MAKADFVQTVADSIDLMVAAGIPQERIAKALKLNRKAMARTYKKSIETAKDRLNGFAVGKLVEGIKKGNPAMIIFYCKTQLGWRERVEVTGKDGGAIEAQIKAIASEGLTKLKDEELKTLRELFLKMGVNQVAANDAAHPVPRAVA